MLVLVVVCFARAMLFSANNSSISLNVSGCVCVCGHHHQHKFSAAARRTIVHHAAAIDCWAETRTRIHKKHKGYEHSLNALRVVFADAKETLVTKSLN